MRRVLYVLAGLFTLVGVGCARPAVVREVAPDAGRAPLVSPLPLPVQTKRFGDLAEGPYNRLVIQKGSAHETEEIVR
jgi:hypothetical protein